MKNGYENDDYFFAGCVHLALDIASAAKLVHV
jgi:hypothetical protein